MEEDLVDLKAIDLENKSISRQIYNKLMDPVYSIPVQVIEQK